jgi:hypothetical protein
MNVDQQSDGSTMYRLGASYREQVAVLLVRAVKIRRFDALGVPRFLSYTLTAIVAGLLWWQRGEKGTLKSAVDISGLLFFTTVRIYTARAVFLITIISAGAVEFDARKRNVQRLLA